MTLTTIGVHETFPNAPSQAELRPGLPACHPLRGQLPPDFDPRVMAVAIRAVIDAVPRRLAHGPHLDVDNYAREIAELFNLATCPDV